MLVLVIACGAPRAVVRDPELGDQVRGVELHHLATEHELANGLSVLLLPDANTNLVEVSVRYAVGAAEDPRDKSGLAHLVEHLMFEVGHERPRIADRLAAVSLTHNAYTTWDATHYSATALEENVDELLAIEAARMAADCSLISEEVFAREREVVRNELRQKSDVASAVEQLLREEVYGTEHVYGRPISGNDLDLEDMQYADACEFISDYYAPERATLVVTGHFDAASVAARIDELFSLVPARRARPRVAVQPVVLEGTDSEHRFPVRRATAFIVAAAPVFADREGAYDLLLRQMLERELIDVLDEAKFVTAVSIGQLGGSRAPIDVAELAVDDPARLEDAVTAFFRARGRVLKSLSLEVVRSERSRAAAGVVAALEAVASRASAFAQFHENGRGGLSIEATVRWLFRATVLELRARAGRFFAREATHIALVYPDEDAPPSSDRLEVEEVARSYDIGEWRMPVDAAEADRSLPLPERGDRLEVRRFELDNGLRVFLVPSLPYPLIDIRVVFPCGTLHDPQGGAGVADAASTLLQHDLAQDFTPDAHEAVLSVLGMGGERTARVRETTTAFRITGLSTYADGLLWQLAWLLEAGVYKQARLDRMRELLRRTRDGADDEQERRLRTLLAALYGESHPYAEDASYRQALDRVTVDKLEAFRRTHFGARGAALIVVGNFDGDDVERRVRRLFGALPSVEAARDAREVPAVAARDRARYFSLDVEEAAQVRISFAFTTAGFASEQGHGIHHVLAEMLRQRMQSLRERFGSTYGISVTLGRRPAAGELIISGAIDAARGGQAMAAMREILAEFRTGDGLAESFVRARRHELQGLLARRADTTSVADTLEQIAMGALPADGYDALAREVAEVRLPDVVELARRELALDREIVVVSGPPRAVRATYAAAGVSDVERIQ